MFNSAILDMVVLLFFTYFICSVLLSVLIEMVATVLNWRADQLQTSLKKFFFDADWEKFVTDKILKSPYYQALQKDETNKPSYVPSENFAKALLENLRDGNNALTIEGIKAKLNTDKDNNIPASLRKVILGYIDTAGNDMARLQSQLEGFYNNAMDRAGGWYKKKTKTAGLIIAGIMVFMLNADTIEIIQKSTHNPDALKAVADRISSEVPNMKYDKKKNTLTLVNPDTKQTEEINLTIADTNSFKGLQGQAEKFDLVKAQLDNKVFSLGYKNGQDFVEEWFKSFKCGGKVLTAIVSLLLKLIGLFLTVLALQVGSTYWFDALNKVVNLRGTGKKPESDPQDDGTTAATS